MEALYIGVGKEYGCSIPLKGWQVAGSHTVKGNEIGSVGSGIGPNSGYSCTNRKKKQFEKDYMIEAPHTVPSITTLC